MPDAHRELLAFLAQLERLPGGPAAAVPDFFGPQFADAVSATPTTFPLRDGTTLRLDMDGSLVHAAEGGEHLIVRMECAPWQAIRDLASAAMPLLPLALMAIALGVVDDRRRLKQALPGVDAAARDLMLMTVCRLCG